MKVFLCKGSFFGLASGADQMLVNYAVHLRRAGHSPVAVIFCPFKPGDPYYQRLRQAGVPVVCLGRHPLYLGLLGLRAVLKRLPWPLRWQRLTDWETLLYYTCVYFLKRNRPDVMHVLVEGGLFLRAARAANVPAIYHEAATPRYGEQVGVFYDRLEAMISYAAGLAGLSPRHAKLCGERLPWGREIAVIPILIEDPGQSPPSPRRAGALVLGFSGRVERLKGVFQLVQAFARVAREIPGAVLRIAGTGEDETALRAEIEALGIRDRCEWVGAYSGPEAMSAFMKGLDILVHPSLAEGTPCSVIEAMAHGRPVIAAAVGGVPDMITEDCGILVPPGEVGSLAEGMLRLLRDPELRERLGQAARRRYEALFSESSVVPLLLRTYEHVIHTYQGRQTREKFPGPLVHPWTPPSLLPGTSP